MNVLTPETTGQAAAPLASAAAEKNIRSVMRSDGICVLTFDRPGSSANIFDLRTLDELARELESVALQTELNGLIFISAKRSVFIAGADLNAMRQVASSDDARVLIERGQAVMNQIAFPVVRLIARRA